MIHIIIELNIFYGPNQVQGDDNNNNIKKGEFYIYVNGLM